MGKPGWGAAGPGAREPGAGRWEPVAGASRGPGEVQGCLWAEGRGEPGPRGGPVSGSVDGGRGPRHVGTAGVGAQAGVGDGVGDGGDGVGAKGPSVGVGAVVLVEAQVGAALAWYSRRSACNTPP